MRGRLGENSVVDTRLWTWTLTPKTISSVTPKRVCSEHTPDLSMTSFGESLKRFSPMQLSEHNKELPSTTQARWAILGNRMSQKQWTLQSNLTAHSVAVSERIEPSTSFKRFPKSPNFCSHFFLFNSTIGTVHFLCNIKITG